MADDRNRRRFSDPRATAEAAFRAATTPKPAAPPPAPPTEPAPRALSVPAAREMVSLRLDSAVLAHFQKDGPGWQDRINAALKALIPSSGD